jgi:HK97 family phage major capsid protein
MSDEFDLVPDAVEIIEEIRETLRTAPATVAPTDARELERTRDRIAERLSTLNNFERLSGVQQAERDRLTNLSADVAELLDRVGTARAESIAVRAERIERVRSAARDPANLERPTGANWPVSARGAGSGPTDPHEYMARSAGYGMNAFSGRSPWDMPERVFRNESLAGRAHDALATIESIPDANRNELVESFEDEQDGSTAARMAVALSDPAYVSAFWSVMRDPLAGATMWGPAERAAMERVRTSMRAAMTIGTGSLGYAVPLVLDPTIILTNSGSANPYRQLASIKRTTSSTWNGVTSTGSSASFYAEGAEIGETSPALAQLQITPKKAAVWLFGSWEAVGTNGTDGDVENFTQQLPRFFADAKDQLEVNTFTTGAGTGAFPTGFLTAVGTGSDTAVAATGTRAASDLTALLEAIPPRFRGGDSRNAYLSNITYLNKYRLTAAFSGANFALVTDDNGPRAFGSPWLENSAMTTGTAATSRVVAYGDWSQMYIADRWPGFVIFEPMVKSATPLPTAQSGWLYAWRTGVGYTTTSAFKVLRFT